MKVLWFTGFSVFLVFVVLMFLWFSASLVWRFDCFSVVVLVVQCCSGLVVPSFNCLAVYRFGGSVFLRFGRSAVKRHNLRPH